MDERQALGLLRDEAADDSPEGSAIKAALPLSDHGLDDSSLEAVRALVKPGARLD